MNVVILLLCCSSVILVQADVLSIYKSRRAKLLEDESKMAIGGNIELGARESELNNKLMQWKFKEVDYWFNNPQYFNFSRSYYEYKNVIKNSKVYQLIRAMPKGAALHVHASGLLGPDYLLNITYREHLHVCFDSKLKFKFSLETPNDACDTHWKLMSDVRKKLSNVTHFDKELRNNFTLVNDPTNVDTDINSTWKRFAAIFDVVYYLVTYKPIWEQYLYDALKKFRDDNIMYVEIRSGFPGLYELNGTSYKPLFFAQCSQQVVKRFTKDFPDFLGAKMIFSVHRQEGPYRIKQALNLTKEMQNAMPDFVAGFDLVGQEDLGGPLVEFIPELTANKDAIAYFFHAGETNWYGTFTDTNIVDAILLEAKRIGHGYALPKHPILMNEIKTKNICVEVNVVSNSLLSLIRDVRNHPLASFIAQGLPIVLSSDDPGLWEADPLSTDFYVSFVGVSSRLQDLRLLKQLALNSISYSSLTGGMKDVAYKMFNAKWEKFVQESLSVQNNL